MENTKITEAFYKVIKNNQEYYWMAKLETTIMPIEYDSYYTLYLYPMIQRNSTEFICNDTYDHYKRVSSERPTSSLIELLLLELVSDVKVEVLNLSNFIVVETKKHGNT